MKKLIAIPLLLIFLLLGTFGVMEFLKMNNSKPNISPTVDNPIPKVEATPAVQKPESKVVVDFTLIKKSEGVSFKTSSEDAYKPMVVNENGLPYGSFIKTGPGAEAYVIYNNNSVMSIAPDSEVQINGSGKNSEVIQLLGRTWHRIQKLAEGENYSVKTKTAIAAVRGTTFDVMIKSASSSSPASEISLIDGEIECSQLTEDKGELKVAEKQTIKPDTTVTLSDFKVNKSWNKRAIPQDKKDEGWYKENRKIDDDYRNKGGEKDPRRMLIDNFIRPDNKIKGVSTEKSDRTLINTKSAPNNISKNKPARGSIEPSILKSNPVLEKTKDELLKPANTKITSPELKISPAIKPNIVSLKAPVATLENNGGKVSILLNTEAKTNLTVNLKLISNLRITKNISIKLKAGDNKINIDRFLEKLSGRLSIEKGDGYEIGTNASINLN